MHYLQQHTRVVQRYLGVPRVLYTSWLWVAEQHTVGSLWCVVLIFVSESSLWCIWATSSAQLAVLKSIAASSAIRETVTRHQRTMSLQLIRVGGTARVIYHYTSRSTVHFNYHRRTQIWVKLVGAKSWTSYGPTTLKASLLQFAVAHLSIIGVGRGAERGRMPPQTSRYQFFSLPTDLSDSQITFKCYFVKSFWWNWW